ncbi:hypothetical protein T265_03293 [Opisthorchis viverrini]|uniref:Uncharacterized protein n=1 Tax=Opisthorchis viverrini TaxID=6198 RepID=A0A074ZS52_OPIVI|nr:hypothetical protein T265_03293 [Opisthorchis viverrini]KER30238.1 hypothetical protein T265_03293 [Opisthorchis viverrini]
MSNTRTQSIKELAHNCGLLVDTSMWRREQSNFYYPTAIRGSNHQTSDMSDALTQESHADSPEIAIFLWDYGRRPVISTDEDLQRYH